MRDLPRRPCSDGGACPAAGVVQQTQRQRHDHRGRVRRGYAIQFTWADGHSTGIYSWSMLRWLCPCAACQQLHGANGTAA
ncbi:MAG: DUF971 domain-containing protein [Anaerolineae bacterium]|nr:MAG: DUF971 domain-containing protein [Anaerolineae bacterium]